MMVLAGPALIRIGRALLSLAITAGTVATVASCSSATAGPTQVTDGSRPTAERPTREYPWHTGIVATTFWVGEIFDPDAPDGSQEYSTYDAEWLAHYGGCDGTVTNRVCQTEPRTSSNGYFPTAMVPLENPFYLDLPFDDLNDPAAFARRGAVVPWAGDPGYAGRQDDESFSYMKNRWVEIRRAGTVCYAQIQDAGPGQYNDAEYVFGSDDRRPKNTKFNAAGLDVSPAVNGCLGFSDINGQSDLVDWRFVEFADVPAGPWRTVVTTSPVTR